MTMCVILDRDLGFDTYEEKTANDGNLDVKPKKILRPIAVVSQ